MAPPLGRVLDPLRVGNLTFRNRIFVPAHTTNYGENHLPSDRHRAYHQARARGGVGAIIFESIRVTPNSLGRPQAVQGFDPSCIAPFRRVTDAVKAEGARILGQIIHLGRQVEGDFERTVSWGASPIPWSTTALPPRPMDEDDMAEVIDGHVKTARNMVEAGFEGIELQMGHGHLLQQFLSPLSNQREDAYGGTIENRLRFPAAVLAAVRAAVGPDLCLGIRVSGDEYVDGGLGIDDVERMVPALAAETRVDFVNVSHSAYHASYSLATQMADMALDPAPFRMLPERIRAALRAEGHAIPVFAVCRFSRLAEADAMIAAGRADAVGMARAHLAEPAIVKKTVAGREDEIRPCVACDQGCAGMLEKNLPIRCLTNPVAGLETVWPEPEDAPAATPRRVLVVGGGPAGLEAARVAAARGHEVTMWERGDTLGGQLAQAAAMPKRAEFAEFLAYERGALARLQVPIAHGVTADADAIAAFAADVVVLATGSDPVRQPLPGGGRTVTVAEAIGDPAALGDTVAVADVTGEWAALAAVEHLADLGKRVSVFVPIGAFAWRTTIYSTLATSRRLRERKVKLMPLRKALAWDGTRLEVEDVSTGERESHGPYSALVFAQHNTADQSLYKALKRRGIDVRQVGDNVAPRTALEAVYHGHMTAREIA
ncbi:FAD-dependent oxidoreductase [Acuticoccus sp. I52.16.1]|uniref:oxidoreductase n=1 Tax=Acuticoccus sp. I52.16.1 TaxID=2928472 RepID=UPI001FD37D07|nr:FAD-dependent oxidoreductase [Acuticoccus sp. I52.16.1]UOM36147.1 FAD-dependent oxidoreductase [Acuticoccus sp. I52.16.1]